MTGVARFVDFLYRDIGNGSLLGFRCCVEHIDVDDCSERILSRLDVRLIVDVAGVYIELNIGICDCFVSESSNHLLN